MVTEQVLSGVLSLIAHGTKGWVTIGGNHVFIGDSADSGGGGGGAGPSTVQKIAVQKLQTDMVTKASAESENSKIDAVAARMQANGITPAQAQAAALAMGYPHGGNAYQDISTELISSWGMGEQVSTEVAASIYMQQMAAQDMFGSITPAYSNTKAWTQAYTLMQNPAVSSVIQGNLQAQYDLTQEDFKARGITSLPIYRGVSITPTQSMQPSIDTAMQAQPIGWTAEGTTNVGLNPLSSFSTDSADARRYAQSSSHGPVGVLLHTDLPVEHILSTGLTGDGNSAEKEVVVIGGLRRMNWKAGG